MARRDDYQRIAVRWRPGDDFGRDVAAGTRTVVDDDLLIDRRAQALVRDDAPWVPLVYPTTAIATSRRVVGLAVSPFGLNNYAKVDLR